MYKLYKTHYGQSGIMRFNADGSCTSFLEDPANTDYQAYLKWLEEGNEVLPADE
jgi:hypothetical protein